MIWFVAACWFIYVTLNVLLFKLLPEQSVLEVSRKVGRHRGPTRCGGWRSTWAWRRTARGVE